MRRDMEKRLKDAKETRQVRMAEELKSMELSPWMIDAATAKKVVGDDATEEQMKEFWAKTIKDMPDDEMTSDNSLYVSNTDTLFMQESKCLYPRLIKEELAFIILEADEPTGTGEEVKEIIQKYRLRIQMIGLQIRFRLIHCTKHLAMELKHKMK